MDKSLLEYSRKSFINLGEIYFWTATINNWHKLLLQDKYKDIVIESLQYLSDNNKVDVFAFVVMPNHIHLIWRTKELNRKETAQGSFLKYTAHAFKKLLKKEAL
jgi:REP element-mobilizing transposase RayT